jgi:hypothetical protein
MGLAIPSEDISLTVRVHEKVVREMSQQPSELPIGAFALGRSAPSAPRVGTGRPALASLAPRVGLGFFVKDKLRAERSQLSILLGLRASAEPNPKSERPKSTRNPIRPEARSATPADPERKRPLHATDPASTLGKTTIEGGSMALWLVPVCMFALFSSIFLGGTAIEPRGGNGLRQVLGLLASAAVFVALWNVLRIGIGSVTNPMAGMIVGSVVAIPVVLLACWIGFIIFGVKLGKAVAAH